ncbi:hypothetical protein [Phytomonospora endophytica]|uniref:Uncharacterized protein n=1 Tax=Phytomonospora endophytica TaxID=714109 RepID=A0A841FN43_9ACTN|nr:hypothetical protein [Phytomonospora endophytica]MBB6035218.1 hypothetical protein [Phytomonospora endophytica]GIG64033.1 hypothetical protein Pen01_03280 [Phytomonospora endophytica]
MSLPPHIIRASAALISAHRGEKGLSFVYSPGLSLAGGEAELVAVWDREELPSRTGGDVPVGHLRESDFAAAVDALEDGEGWRELDAPVKLVAGFAYGVMLSDRSGVGTKTRGRVSVFPYLLTDRSEAALSAEAGSVAAELAECADGWARAHLLDEALHRAYVAWFASHQRFWPGRTRRYEWVRHFGLSEDVADLEHGIWNTSGAAGQAELYAGFVDKILAD